jgi:probable phosphoglycerate mutase
MARDGATQATTMLLVRHGQSTWNAEGRWQGHANPPLSALGRAQAIAAAATMPAVDLVVTSDLDRASETGRLIAEALGVPAIVEHELHERDIGAWTGLTRDEIETSWPGSVDNGHRPDGWEDDADAAARGMAALCRLARTYPGRRLLVVTHGGLIRAIERELEIASPHLANLGGLWIEVRDNEITVRDRAELIDHTAVAATVPESE